MAAWTAQLGDLAKGLSTHGAIPDRGSHVWFEPGGVVPVVPRGDALAGLTSVRGGPLATSQAA